MNKQSYKSKIKKDDTVLVIAGNHKGDTGKVMRCSGEKVWVQGLNKAKKHMKGSGDRPGQIVEMEKPIHVSNLKVCVDGDQPVKLKVRFTDDGAKELAYRKDGNWVSYRTLSRKKESK